MKFPAADNAEWAGFSISRASSSGSLILRKYPPMETASSTEVASAILHVLLSAGSVLFCTTTYFYLEMIIKTLIIIPDLISQSEFEFHISNL